MTRFALAGVVVALAGAAASVVAAQDIRLAAAVQGRNVPVMRRLLREHVDVNVPQPTGVTALHWAAHWDDVDTAAQLIRAGARVNAADDDGVTPLWLACTNGSAPMVRELLQAGANPNTTLPTGETVLMAAARSGTADVVKALLDRGAKTEAVERTKGQTALMWAVAERHLETVTLLVANGANVRTRSTAGFSPLSFAAREADLDITNVLLAAGADINEAAADGATPLLVATIRGNSRYAEHLLDRGADPNAGWGLTPLHRAAGNWASDGSIRLAENTEWSALTGLKAPVKLAFVETLLAHGADPNARIGRNPGGYGGGGSPDLMGATPFLLAALSGDVDVMRALLAGGADPFVSTVQGTTPLIMAAGVTIPAGVDERTALDAVKLCLDLGLEINAANDADETALHGAAYRGADSIVQFLVDRGAKLNAKDKRGWTALTIAEGIFLSSVIKRYPSTVELLQKLGADPSPADVNRIGQGR